jgi:hypothetical protein
MSEKLFALLLRLYPSSFRARYGSESLQLFRDRAQQEQGLYLQLRLWADILADFAVSLPREYRKARPALLAASAGQSSDGTPSFDLLESKPLRPEVLASGALLSLVVLAASCLLIRHAGDELPNASRAQHPQSAAPSSGERRHPSEKAIANTKQAPSTPRPTAKAQPASADPHSAYVPANAPKQLDSAALLQQQASAQKAQASASVASAPQTEAKLDSAQLAPANPQDATVAMLQAFQTHDIVMFGEAHGSKQEYEWLCKLVNTPEFADRVDDIVVEFGNARYQKTVDRYVAGGDVPIEEVRKAWRDMVLSVVPVQPVYEQFYKAVREANLKHPGKHQLRIVLGSPPADWDKIKSRKDLEPYMNERDQWYAQVAKGEVLAKHHHALLIMGAGHFLRGQGPGMVERELRAAGANPYLVVLGTNAVDNDGNVDKRFDSWPMPAIVTLSGNWVGQLPAQPVVSGGHAPATPRKLADEADAMLYVAPCKALTVTYVQRADVDGTPYGNEIARRNAIILGHPENFIHEETEPQCVQPKRKQGD